MTCFFSYEKDGRKKTSPDDTWDPDATPTYNATAILEKTAILDIATGAEDYVQISLYNDSGISETPHNLTITKTVAGNMGEHDREFEFVVTLWDMTGAPDKRRLYL